MQCLGIQRVICHKYPIQISLTFKKIVFLFIRLLHQLVEIINPNQWLILCSHRQLIQNSKTGSILGDFTNSRNNSFFLVSCALTPKESNKNTPTNI